MVNNKSNQSSNPIIETINKYFFIAPLFLVFSFVSQYIWHWQIDDAGIAFAYAKNIANGYGIVAQPGAIPVEGISDLLWVLIMVPFFKLSLFDPIVTPKYLSLIFFFMSYINFSRYLLTYNIDKFYIVTGFLFSAVTIPIIIYSSSGLENPLFLFLISVAINYLGQEKIGKKQLIILISSSCLLIITRPEGILYALVPMVVFLLFSNDFPGSRNPLISNVIIYSGSVLLFLSLLTLFRYLYFNDFIPNTIYSKGDSSSSNIIEFFTLGKVWMKFIYVFKDNIGIQYFSVFIVSIFAYIFLKFKKVKVPDSLYVYSFFALISYVLMPNDWMRNGRFAYYFYVLFFLSVCTSLALIFKDRKFEVIVKSCMLICLYFLFVQENLKIIDYRAHPDIPFEGVAREGALTFQLYSEMQGLKKSSVLTPDIGGMLYYTKQKIFDLAGLIDKRYALVTRGKNNQALADLVFGIDKPDFINLHSNWSFDTELYKDPRFFADYEPIFSTELALYEKSIIQGHFSKKANNPSGIDLGTLKIFEAEDLFTSVDKALSMKECDNFYKNKVIIANEKLIPKPDFLSYGPYAAFSAGRYIAQFTLRSPNETASENEICAVDISCNLGQTLAVHSKVKYKDICGPEFKNIQVIFTLDSAVTDAEFRVYYYGKGTLEYDRVKVAKFR